MKFKFTKLFILVAGVALMFASCKKSSSSTSSTAETPKQVSGQIALNLSQSLFGTSYGVDLSNGLNAPSAFAIHTKGKVLNDLTDPFCGLTVDTTLSYTFAQHDTTIAVAGTINFSFICASGTLSGFTAAESFNVNISTSQLKATDKVAENLTLVSLNPLDSTSNLSMKGTLSSDKVLTYATVSAGKSGEAQFSYTLTALVLDPNADDVVSGTATFSTSGSGASGTWNYSGTIVFLGNHMAKVTINGASYTVNLETGVVS